jgi:hypothetical protein
MPLQSGIESYRDKLFLVGEKTQQGQIVLMEIEFHPNGGKIFCNANLSK